MNAYTGGHLRTWAMIHRPDNAEALIEKITAFVAEHPDLLESPRNASWPEIEALTERDLR